MKLSKHSKIRLKERTTLNHAERRQIFRLALTNGICIDKVKNERIKRFMMSKQRYNSQVKLYRGYVFIYSRNSHQLYTMYELPNDLKSQDIFS